MAERAEVVVQSGLDAEEGPAVRADRQRLLQVVSHLVSNAIKYNRPGGQVDISCDVVPHDKVRLAVADTGRGIRPEDLVRVFEPFDRLDAEQSGVDGTGVGLALARSLVERMSGSITVESVPEVGSTFFVELPMAVVPDDSRPGTMHRPAGGPGTPPRVGFRVLLVEEDLSSSELVERVLARRPGVTVIGARDGSRALEAARAQNPDLILLDLQLPDMSGAALLDELGQDPACASIPVAVLSAEAGTGQVRRLLGRGVAGQLTKPIDVRALLSLVDAARAASGK
jgi:CheY-like chemotaxis protein